MNNALLLPEQKPLYSQQRNLESSKAGSVANGGMNSMSNSRSMGEYKGKPQEIHFETPRMPVIFVIGTRQNETAVQPIACMYRDVNCSLAHVVPLILCIHTACPRELLQVDRGPARSLIPRASCFSGVATPTST